MGSAFLLLWAYALPFLYLIWWKGQWQYKQTGIFPLKFRTFSEGPGHVGAGEVG